MRPARTTRPPRRGPAESCLTVVGVGASAGGLEAFTRLLEKLPAKVGTAFVFVQHLDPTHESHLTELNGFDAVRQIEKSLPDIKAIFLSIHANPAYVNEAFYAGAGGYILKHAAASELITAIQEVLSGRSYVSPSLAKDLIDQPGADSPRRENPAQGMAAGLTLRQKEVLQLLAEGHTYKEIAQRLHISIKTVEFHRARIVSRLGLRSTAELTRYALEQGIISLEAPVR